jgi:hypothetical protein
LGIPAHELNNTVYELLKGTVTLKETIIERNGLSLVPSSLNLSGAEILTRPLRLLTMRTLAGFPFLTKA